MTMDKLAEIPTCSLVEIVYNKWLRQSRNNMTCMKEVKVDVLIWAFMLIANYNSWLKGDSTNEGSNSLSLTWRLLLDVEIQGYLHTSWSLIPCGKISILVIVLWRAPSYLDPPNASLICCQMEILTHIDPTKGITRFLTLTIGLKWHA